MDSTDKTLGVLAAEFISSAYRRGEGFALQGCTIVDHIVGTDLNGPQPYGLIIEDQFAARWVVLRGTNDIEEWIEDAEFWPTSFEGIPHAEVITGAYNVFKTLRVGDGTPLLDAMDRFHYIAGHSLGGWLANMIAASLQATCLITFAAPRTGNAAFNALSAKTPWQRHYVNPDDVVPKMPPFYEPFGTPIFVQFDPRLPKDWATQHSIDNYLSALQA